MTLWVLKHQKTPWRSTMRKKTILALFAFLAIGIVVSTAVVSAYGVRGFADDESKGQALGQISEDHIQRMQEREQYRELRQQSQDEIRAAIEAGDYNTWKSLVEGLDRYPVDVETITESDFNTLVEMHNARISGDWETADGLASELGWERPEPMGVGKGSGQGRGHSRAQGRMMGGLGDCPYAD